MLGNEEEPDVYELHICVKDYNFARSDSLIGVAIMQVRDIVEQVSFSLYTVFLIWHLLMMKWSGLDNWFFTCCNLA